MEVSHPPAPRSSLVRPLLAVSVLTAGVVAVWYFFLRTGEPATPPTPAERRETPTPDPRLTFETPLLNVRPDVKYVGDAACLPCHRQITDSYHHHPMGRSAAVVGKETPLERYDAAAQNPFRVDVHTLSVVKGGDRVTHRLAGNAPATTAVPPHDQTADVVIGSGTRGRSYLCLDRGSAWQTPISWFTDDARWNISPGFNLGGGGARAVIPDCLFCHVDRTDPVPRSINLYRQAVVGQANIGCERCHGPGELHARKQADTPTGGGADETIVNPKRLSADLQMDICRQCHLQGEQRIARRGREFAEFRPGLPLDLFMSVFVRRPDLADPSRSVGQFEQMERSGCFTKSAGAMTCTTCHDPHAVPETATKSAFFNGKCQTCHATRGCTERPPIRRAKNDNCVACHMPRKDSTSIAHAAITDHRIPRRATAPPAAPAATTADLPIVPYRKPTAVPPAEFDRDYALALARQLKKLDPGSPQGSAAGRETMARLRAATERFPSDEVAWTHLMVAAGMLSQPNIQRTASRTAGELQPDSEAVLQARVGAELSLKEYQSALRLAEELIALNPAAVEHREMRASVLIVLKDWARAEAAASDAIATNPQSAEAHILRAMALNGLGRKDEADREADIGSALETNPDLRRQRNGWLRSK